MSALFIALVVAFLATFFSAKYFITKFKAIGLVSTDINKKEKPIVPEMGGIAIFFGMMLGLSIIILAGAKNTIELLAVLSTVLLSTVFGILDGIFGYLGYEGKITRKSRKWKRGITQLQHAIFPLLCSIPLIAIKAGHYSMALPLIGDVNLGLLYPFLIIPLIVTIYNNAFNMIAGMNGLEAGSGLIISLGLLVCGIILGQNIVITLSSLLAVCLLAFLFFNFYPAKVFPGDITPFIVGSVLASAIILGNIEKVGVIIIGLYYLEFLLKLRSGFKAQSFGVVQEDGSLKAPHEKIYSLTHLVMKLGGGKLKERQIVTIIILLHSIPILLALLTLSF
ncbi:hypothetical protein A3K63_00580 [Candidatus Micrarchaeota archaeon RBG_16_49_10]|nr:MAG: hypothetical protein A3K63_00580 [Candidatus Micrarchaeota archaeon RBG_16_49_10]